MDDCPHWSATGVDHDTSFEKAYRCDSCGMVYRNVIDPAGEIRYANGVRARMEIISPGTERTARVAVRIEPDLIGGLLAVPYWEIWDAETYETVSQTPIPDAPNLTAEEVLAQWQTDRRE